MRGCRSWHTGPFSQFVKRMSEHVDQVIIELFDKGAVKIGNYRLKSGIDSPIYIDLRVIVSYPKLHKKISDLIYSVTSKNGLKHDILCGVPYTALPIATLISAKHDIPMVMRRKEAKDYGTKKLIEGVFEKGDKCLVIEDLVTSGSSTMETVEVLRAVGLDVTDAVVLLDREQGGKANLKKHGINLHSVCTMSRVLAILEKESKINSDDATRVKNFLLENSNVAPVTKTSGSTKLPTYKERANSCQNPAGRSLLETMHRKRSNLAAAVDVLTTAELLRIVDEIGPFICLLKTHLDVLTDCDPDLPKRLIEVAKSHDFLIMEDRKYSDIGNTVKMQYSGGIHRVSDWSHFVTAHALPGPGLVTALKEVSKEKGCILVAEMSSQGALTNKDYAAASVAMATSNADFVAGLVSQSRLIADRGFIQMTPGIKLSSNGDGADQQYVSPREAIVNRGADVIIVGRAIVEAPNAAAAAAEYRRLGWQAYEETI